MASRATVRLGAAGALWVALATAAAADEDAAPLPAAASDANISYLTPPSSAANPLLQRTRDFQGVPLSGWMFYPEFLAEGIYNNNLALTSTDPRGAFGVRLHPDFYALRDTGLSKTEVYSAADIDLYPGAQSDNQVNGTLGVAETYQPTPDLTIKGQAQFDRLGGFGTGGEVIGPNGAPTNLVAPSQSNRAEASLGAQKSFGRFFLGGAVTVSGVRYDPLATAVGSLSQSYRDGVMTTLTERAGYWISPLLYGYAETAENWRQYADEGLRSNGYRAVAGLGSDRLSLFRGEMFAGYQAQLYSAPLPGAASSPVLGAKLYWYPTRALTVSGSLDESFTDSANPEPGNPRGNPARDIALAFDMNYQLHRQWSLYALGRVDRAYTIGAPRIDTTYLGSTRLNYELRRNVDLTLSNTYTRVDSNAMGGSYVDDIASLGARYRF